MSKPLPTPTEIRAWLERIQRDRQWLGDTVGATKLTVHSWFSTKGFPVWALKSIQRLMEDQNLGPSLSEVTFTAGEFESIEKAREAACYTNRRAFYRDAILEKVRRELENTSEPPANITPMPKVAEEPATYRTSGTSQPGATRNDPDAEIRRQLDDDNLAN